MNDEQIKYYLLTLMDNLPFVPDYSKILYAVIKIDDLNYYEIVRSVVFHNNGKVTHNCDKGKKTHLVSGGLWNIKKISKEEFFIYCI